LIVKLQIFLAFLDYPAINILRPKDLQKNILERKKRLAISFWRLSIRGNSMWRLASGNWRLSIRGNSMWRNTGGCLSAVTKNIEVE
jgi:hypothetical protein